ncbi:hypothetical protein EST38_g12426 [Candolleomyces aberdarensis]|uniref:FAD-binding PCMH-type domain-containing protein n=1 Tax=Candolleomyces aberdarensis TaxID=2316362 RepID=A0A4Q2D2H0_9AGAR|nr:hypothetical protein EST38_g12426 [Candolleomyces aberdarensis]
MQPEIQLTSNQEFVGERPLLTLSPLASLLLVADLGTNTFIALYLCSQPFPSDVGTGLLLGGGLSYLSARHGFSVDALVEADVVLVDGRLVTANATNEYADLFKALKGGASRFGIVTRYEVKAIHVGTNEEKMMVGGSVIYDNSTTEALLRATANYVNNVEDSNTSLLVIIGATMDNNTVSPVNVITFFYNGTSLPEGFANPYHEFLSLPYLASAVGSYSYAEANSVLGSGGDKGSGQAFGASAFGSAEWDISQGLVNDEEESFESMAASTSASVFLLLPSSNLYIEAGIDGNDSPEKTRSKDVDYENFATLSNL